RGEPGAWPSRAQRIMVHEDVMDAWNPLPCRLEIIGNPKQVLKQMLDCVRSLIKRPPKRTAWLEHLERVKATFDKGMNESIEEVRDWKPVHAFVLGKEIVDFLDPSATIILDSFTGSAHLTDKIKAKFPGQVLDSGECGGVGHGIGMGIGAQLARPGKQVFVMMGDGGMGIGGMDIETALRYKLPVVYLVYNNSTWMGGCEEKYFEGLVDTWAMLPDLRYDKMFEVIGCHGELVTEHQQIRPALERAFNSGKPAVVNVLCDSRVCNPTHLTKLYLSIISRVTDMSKLPEVKRELIMKGYIPEVQEKLKKEGWPPMKVKSKISHRDLIAPGGAR
ncbi:MAG: thiamine pyrophosphate-dependent enzyme, partial [Chloroflexota bacterium]|nr:thiamine pyrophosphate-dependent enzyme [Chloroflexota bacterium]